MHIDLEIPDHLAHLATAQEWLHKVSLNTALLMYKQGQLTVGQASELAHLPVFTFMQECGKNGIPVIDYEPEELESELELIRRLSS